MKRLLVVFLLLILPINIMGAVKTKTNNKTVTKIKKQKAKPAPVVPEEELLTRAQVVHMPFIIASDFTVQDPASKQNKFMVTAATGGTEVTGSLKVSGSTTLASTTISSLGVTGNEVVGGTLGVTGATTLAGVAASSLNVSGASTLTGNTTVGGTLGVTGATTLASTTISSLGVTGNEMVGGTLSVVGATTLDDVTVNGLLTATDNLILPQNLEVDGTAFFDGTVIIHDGLLVGQKTLTDTLATSTQTLLQLVLPDAANYIGLVNVTYLANIKQGSTVTHLEVATAKYLISRMDVTQTATVSRIEDSYCNETGSIDVPESSGSVYAKILECEYNSQWTPGDNKRVVNVRYLPPTAAGADDTSVTVLYEVRSGPGALGRSLQVS